MSGYLALSPCCAPFYRTRPLFLPFLLFIFLASCSRVPLTPTSAPMLLRGAGSAIVADAWPGLAATFAQDSGGQIAAYEPLTSGLALEELAAGRWDFAISTDPFASARFPELSFTPITADALAIIVHPRTQLANLTLAQARDLFGGYVQDWSALGAGSSRVQLVSRDEGSGARSAFTSVVMAGQPLALTALLLPDDAEVINYVASHPGSAGFASTRLIPGDALNAGQPVRIVALEDLQPGEDGYALARAIDLVLPRSPSPVALALRDFLLSDKGQDVLRSR